MTHACPRCGGKFTGKQLLVYGQPLWKSYRICIHCKQKIIIDKKSKSRQLIIFFLAMLGLILFLIDTVNARLLSGAVVFVAILYVFYSETKINFLPYYPKEYDDDKPKAIGRP